MTDFTSNEADPIAILQFDDSAAAQQRAQLAALRQTRDAAQVERTLTALLQAAESTTNAMTPVRNAVRTYAPLGEVPSAPRVSVRRMDGTSSTLG